jgi:hypothetical protein
MTDSAGYWTTPNAHHLIGCAKWVYGMKCLLLAEDVAHAADLGAYAAELLFEVLVAAVHVVDAVEDALAVGDEGGEDEGCGGA